MKDDKEMPISKIKTHNTSTKAQIREDFLARHIERIWGWVAKHPQTALAVTAVVLGSTLLAIYVNFNLKRLDRISWERLAMAQSYFQMGNNDTALNILNELIGRYSRKSVGAYACMLKGDINYQLGKFDIAIQSYKDAIQVAHITEILPLANMSLANSEENMGNLSVAETHYQEFIKLYPDHFLAARAYQGLARVQELQNKFEDARSSYEKIVTLYPTSTWAEQARYRITKIRPNK